MWDIFVYLTFPKNAVRLHLLHVIILLMYLAVPFVFLMYLASLSKWYHFLHNIICMAKHHGYHSCMPQRK